MQKFTQKYTIVGFVERVEENFQFDWKNWPLHVTIAPVFAIGLDTTTLLKKLAELLTAQVHFKIVAAHGEYFGPEKDIRVTIMSKSSELTQLHYDVVNFLKNNGAVFNKPHYIS